MANADEDFVDFEENEEQQVVKTAEAEKDTKKGSLCQHPHLKFS